MENKVKDEELKTVAGGDGEGPKYKVGQIVWLTSSGFSRAHFRIENVYQSYGWRYSGTRKNPSGKKEFADIPEEKISCVCDNQYYIDNF